VTSGWNLAEIWERTADRFPEAISQIQGDRVFTWRDFDRRADGIAKTLLDAGAQHQDKVAQYLYNCPEYMESMFGIFKAALVPVNTNYRYTDDEIVYLWDNADAIAVIFHGTFATRCDALRARLPAIRSWLWVDDGSGECPEWATPYEAAAASAKDRTNPDWGRSADDLYMLYTGGTTGMPKGVMWRQDDVLHSLDVAPKNPLPDVPGWDAVDAAVTRPGPRNLAAAPLMHGTGAFNAMRNFSVAGSVVTLQGRHFDPIELLDTVEVLHVNSVSIVGDAFAKPILRALDAEPERWDISSLRVMISSGVMWSSQTKAGLLRHNARLIMVDSLGSSEAIGMGTNTTDAGTAGENARFVLSDKTKVLNEDGEEVRPGSGERGRVAIRGRTPVGYYKDPDKSASTFVTFEGVRWSIPGDFAEVDADGTVRFLGRGSQCINTGGEKVYPEEVEEALKNYPGVADAAVVGLPDDRFGEAITALVEPLDGAKLDEVALVLNVKETLAAFKAPKRLFVVDTVGRAANGKLDYQSLKIEAARLAEVSLDMSHRARPLPADPSS
jgi:acyl-CoA synthetase (AMP-forming)/AMP-acid ligase II